MIFFSLQLEIGTTISNYDKYKDEFIKLYECDEFQKCSINLKMQQCKFENSKSLPEKWIEDVRKEPEYNVMPNLVEHLKLNLEVKIKRIVDCSHEMERFYKDLLDTDSRLPKQIKIKWGVDISQYVGEVNVVTEFRKKLESFNKEEIVKTISHDISKRILVKESMDNGAVCHQAHLHKRINNWCLVLLCNERNNQQTWIGYSENDLKPNDTNSWVELLIRIKESLHKNFQTWSQKEEDLKKLVWVELWYINKRKEEEKR